MPNPSIYIMLSSLPLRYTGLCGQSSQFENLCFSGEYGKLCSYMVFYEDICCDTIELLF